MSYTAKQKFLMANEPGAKRFKAIANAMRKSQAAAQAVYRKRRKLGLQPLKKPWDYMTCAEVKNMAWQAYRVASFEVARAVVTEDGRDVTHQRLREEFAALLAEMFNDAVMAHAVMEGGCWPVADDTPPYRNYPRVWELMSTEVPPEWRPEYPFYRPVEGTPLFADRQQDLTETMSASDGR